ncbi:serine hydrolase domain-containing protein [Bacteroidota bacterium]
MKKKDRYISSFTFCYLDLSNLKGAALFLLLLISFLILGSSCEMDRDFSSEFPSRAILGSGSYEGPYWPTQQWKSCTPEEVGMDSKLLRMMNEDMVLQKRLHIDVHSVHVIRKGYLVAEQYYSPEFGADSLHYIYSCTKSVTSAAFGIAKEKGFMPSLDTPLLDFFPEYNVKNPYGKDQITLKHALTLSDGFEWYELQYPYGDDRNTFTQWRQSGGSIEYVLDLPMKELPGSNFNYNSGVSHLLSVVIQKQTGIRMDSFVRQELFTPLGITDYSWTINQDGAAKGYAGLYLRPHDLAKFGLLYLNNGTWEDKQLIPESWVRESTDKHILRGDIPGFYYGYQWWVHESGLYAAVGFGGQLLIVDPEYDLVVVFTNYHNETDWFQQNTPWRLLETFIIPAIIN